MKQLFTSLALVGAMAFGANAQTINDDCATAMPLTVGSIADLNANAVYIDNATILATTGSTDGLQDYFGGAEDDLWFSFVATKSIATIMVNSNEYYDAVIEVYNGTCGNLNLVGAADFVVEEDTETISLSSLAVGETYYVRVYDYYSDTHDFPGEFVIAMTDEDVCENDANPLTLTYTNDNGTLTAVVSGGVAPYTYYWGDVNENEFTTESVSGYVTDDLLMLAVTDADGCQRYTYVVVGQTPLAPIVVSVSDINANYNMSVFPNPASTVATVTLETANYTELQLELVNINGQVVYSQAVAQEGQVNYQLPIANLAAGVYFVKASSKAGVSTQRLIIAK